MRELGRRGVEGREGGLFREAEVERLGLDKSMGFTQRERMAILDMKIVV